MNPEDIAQFYVRNTDNEMVPLSALATVRRTYGPEYTNRFNVFRAAQVTGAAAPGYSSGQALAALEEVAAQMLPREMGYDWSDLVLSGEEGGGHHRPGLRAVDPRSSS